MKKKKKLWLRVLPWTIILLALAALVWFVFVPIYSVRESVNTDLPVMYAYSGDGKPIVMENEELLFSLDPVTTQFTLTQKDTGYTWYSNPQDADKDPIALKADKEKLKSTVLVNYGMVDGVTSQFNSYAYSVENGVYEIEQHDDQSVSVRYTIGKVSKVYYIPVAVPEARMDELCAAMSKSDKRKATDAYRLIDPKKYKANDDVGALEAMYPGLKEGKMYILRDGTADHMKVKLVGYFSAVGYTAEDYYEDIKNVAGSDEKEKAVFNVTLKYRLSGSDFIVEVPYDEIRFYDTYPVTYVTPLPCFGAAGSAEEGYILVPDGGGAIIKYNNGKLSQNSYYANLYGWDWAQERRQAVNETRCSFPAFGMTGGGHSFLCILEGNVSYAGIQADIGGRLNSYNTCSARYAVLHSDQFDVSAKSNDHVFMYEKRVPEGAVKQIYRFLPTDNYVDMAHVYRNYLTARYPNLTLTDNDTLPVTVEVLGAIDKTVQRFGVPVSMPLPMTTFDEAGDIMDSLLGAGVKDLTLYYTGWCNNGVQQRVLTSIYLVDALGGEDKLKAFTDKARAAGVDTYLDGDVTFANDSGIMEGFIAFRDAAKYTTGEKVMLYPYSSIWYTPMEWRDPFYVVKPKYMLDCAKKLTDAVKKLGATGVMYRDVGSILSADYSENDLTTREQSKQYQLDAMRYTQEQGQKVAVKIGNDYALTYASFIAEMDLTGGRYSIFDVEVPFYQIALHGLVDFSGTPINLAGDYTEQLLRCAEYGAGLNFAFMAEEAKILQDTFFSGYYGNNFSQWGGKAVDIINRYQSDMAGLQNQMIIGHERLSADVSVTEYEGGARVYVNYGDTPYTDDGVTVPARDYAVKGGR